MRVPRLTDAATRDPRRFYRFPRNVLTDRRLSPEEKKAVLLAWKASEQELAGEDEGSPEEPSVFSLAVAALAQLDTLQEQGRRLQALRQASTLEQDEFASLIGLSTNALGQVERALRSVSETDRALQLLEKQIPGSRSWVECGDVTSMGAAWQKCVGVAMRDVGRLK